MKVLNALKWRYAVKKFDVGRKISSEEWDTLESTLALTPSGYGLQPWRFLVIQNPGLRKLLTPHSLGQTQVEECSHLIVFCAKTSVEAEYIESHVAEVSRVRGVPRENLEGYYQMMVDDLLSGPKSAFIGEWAARQTYIALGTLVMAAALLKIDACPLEGIVPEKYDEILKLNSTGYRTLCACALGYRSEEDKYSRFPKVRFEKEKIIQTI